MKKFILSSLSLVFFVANAASSSAFCREVENEKEKAIETVLKKSEVKNKETSVSNDDEIAKKRKEIVEYMENMSNVEWSPLENILYWSPKMGFVYKKGGKYYGIPYTQLNRNINLGKFCENLKDADGKKIYVGPYKNGEYMGTDCSMAVIMAWYLAEGDSVFSLKDTVGMFTNLGKGILAPVGKYRYTGKEQSTSYINENNGKDVIFKSYEKLKPGDALLTCSYNWNWHSGHVRLVVNVDIENKTIEYIDQAGVDNDGRLYSRNGKSSWRHSKVSFEESFKKGYIAVGLSKLLKTGNT